MADGKKLDVGIRTRDAMQSVAMVHKDSALDASSCEYDIKSQDKVIGCNDKDSAQYDIPKHKFYLGED